MPTGVGYGITGQDLILTCTTVDTDLTKFEFYKAGTSVGALSTTKEHNVTDTEAGDYHCIAAKDDGTKTAATESKTIEFKSKSFLILHLKDK